MVQNNLLLVDAQVCCGILNKLHAISHFVNFFTVMDNNPALQATLNPSCVEILQSTHVQHKLELFI